MNIKQGPISASARIRFEVEVVVGDKWGSECSIDQIHKQAAENAFGIIRQMVEKTEEPRVRIIGEPTLSVVVVEKKP